MRYEEKLTERMLRIIYPNADIDFSEWRCPDFIVADNGVIHHIEVKSFFEALELKTSQMNILREKDGYIWVFDKHNHLKFIVRAKNLIPFKTESTNGIKIRWYKSNK